MIAKVYKATCLASGITLRLYWIDLKDIVAISSLNGEDDKFFEIHFKNGNSWSVCCDESNPYAELLTKWQISHG